MSMPEHELLGLIRELRDNQRVQLERQADAIALQREQFNMVKRQFDNAERLQQRAEAIQKSGAKAMKFVVLLILMAFIALGAILFPALKHYF